MRYKVKLDIFEGPFDLLVYLIERAEMSIYDIQISEITDQYIDYLEDMKKADAVLAGEFMVLASTLIEIKSKMLLPRKSKEEGQEDLEDPRNELIQRLVEYKKYKKVAAFLENKEKIVEAIYTKPKEDLSRYTEEPDIFFNLDIQSFIKGFSIFIQRKKRLEEVHKRYSLVRQQKMTVESKIEEIKKLLESKDKIEFRELLGEMETRQNIVITFLIMLELIKQKTVSFDQESNYGEITFIIDRDRIDKEKGEEV